MDLKLVNGRHKDLPIQRNFLMPVVTAGSANDFEWPIDVVPDLTLYYSNAKALAPNNTLVIRTLNLIFAAAVTGSDTHYVTININQWRAGSKLATLATYAFTHTPNNSAVANLAIDLLETVAEVKILPGDVLTYQRVSNDSTGLALPVHTVALDYKR